MKHFDMGFCGGVFLIALLLITDIGSIAAFKGETNKSLMAALLAPVCGAFIYALHRAVPYPLFIFVVRRTVSCECLARICAWACFARIRTWVEDQRASDWMRWKALNGADSPAKGLSEWTAQVHFLYGAGWALLLSLALAKALPDDIEHPHSPHTTARADTPVDESRRAAKAVFKKYVEVLFAVTLASALIHHFRYVSRELWAQSRRDYIAEPPDAATDDSSTKANRG